MTSTPLECLIERNDLGIADTSESPGRKLCPPTRNRRILYGRVLVCPSVLVGIVGIVQPDGFDIGCSVNAELFGCLLVGSTSSVMIVQMGPPEPIMSAMLALAYPIKEGVERLLRRTGPWVPGSDVPHSRKVDAQTIAFEVVGHCKLSLLEESPTSTNRSSRCPKHPRQERACLGSLQWGTDSLGLSARRHLIAFNPGRLLDRADHSRRN